MFDRGDNREISPREQLLLRTRGTTTVVLSSSSRFHFPRPPPTGRWKFTSVVPRVGERVRLSFGHVDGVVMSLYSDCTVTVVFRFYRTTVNASSGRVFCGPTLGNNYQNGPGWGTYVSGENTSCITVAGLGHRLRRRDKHRPCRECTTWTYITSRARV